MGPFIIAGTISDNVTALLVAVFGGAATSILAGYLSRPKTKAEAKKENATADVSMSGDAREWATFWATKAQDAEKRADDAESARDSSDNRTLIVEQDRRLLVEYVRLLEETCHRESLTLPPLPKHIRDVIGNPEDF